jgi:hypothetical protein
MAWNIEVVAVRTDEPDDAVPDVFGPTDIRMHFEDATSAMRDRDLCAAKVRDWVVVIDVRCQLSGHAGYLAEASASTDLHVVRVAGEPLALHYRDGRQVAAARGRDACLEIAPRDDRDGELCAMDILAGRTGVTWSRDLWDAGFTLYRLD